MLSAFCCCGFCRDASGKSMTRFTFSAGSYHWGDDHPNALARKVKFFIKRGVVRPRHNAWTSDKPLDKKLDFSSQDIWAMLASYSERTLRCPG